MQKRYSKYLRPISYFFDIVAVLLLFPYFFKGSNVSYLFFGTYLFLAWTILSFFSKLYAVYRFTTPVQILTKVTVQFLLFLLVVISFFPFYKTSNFSGSAIALYSTALLCVVLIFKAFLFFYIKKYRLITGNNYRNTIIVGYTKEAIDLKNIFENRPDYGYHFKGFFSDKKENKNIIGKSDLIKDFCMSEKIDEIYCSLNEISNEKLKDLIFFTDQNKIELKFIPDTKAIFSKNLKVDYYELFPVLSLRKTPLDEPYIKAFKRVFDVVFSFFVITLLLSWLVPLMAILIKLESKGPIFFKQNRPGINESDFVCYKFRSMKINESTEMEASRNDPRVTKIGKFIRKTSIDELPQFFNVLLGDMSIVGPRPHLWSQNKIYASKIQKYMVRHYVKPGITGLAQVKGYRGEIETDDDMINRIKFDVFYIENWSLLMDVKIIFQTVINIFKGEEKAY
ncbi:undecaprenyl-phosphate glucose phosphotransferase [Flavobacterium sp. N2270]|uniref:undecaprenyl-phosphate glucose phosphotransferase n=1 Tax=Flavobacterium sp. N2270 TaxID=2986831 RepID=UPI00222561F8|nr:undecaprenyl-phosphate glucose phosphotransferase [Flavobacterium sp. N2270]